MRLSATAFLLLALVCQTLPAQNRRPVRRIPVTPELERTAFRDPQARATLARARAARVAQDSALNAYVANTYLRMSAGLGLRRFGPQRLLFRSEQSARVSWSRDGGVTVQPVGRRSAFPMGHAEVDLAGATPIPFFPGRETLWFPGSGVMETEVNENELLHPLAVGAEAYYQYASGDSANIRLPDGTVIALRELRVTARRPEWRAFVGSFWFDIDRGSLVRAAYRLAVEMDIWQIAGEESRHEIAELQARLKSDTGAVLDSLRDELKRARSDARYQPLTSAILSPMRASISGITVEYGLHQGRFWLPRLNVAEGEFVATIARFPIKVEERYSYDVVSAATAATAADSATAVAMQPEPAARDTVAADTGYVGEGHITINVGTASPEARARARASRPRISDDSLIVRLRHTADSLRAASDSLNRTGDTALAGNARRQADRVAARARMIERRRDQCAHDSTYYAGTTNRFDGALRMAIRMPCDTTGMGTSPDLPPSIFDEGEEVFGTSERDALLDALGMGLQPAWSPQRPVFHTGLDLLRYNKIEGLSPGATLTSALGLGYTAQLQARIGSGDRVPNGELSLSRSNGRTELQLAAYHRLGVANDDFGAPLSFGASLGNLIDAGDEGVYYRALGAELSGMRRAPLFGVPVRWRLFAERQRSAGVGPNTRFSLGDLWGNPRFGQNIDATPLNAAGIRLETAHTFGVNPVAPRFDTRLRLEGAATDRSDVAGSSGYGRYVGEGTFAFPLARFAVALTGAAGTSSGALPIQRAFFVGGLHTVRGQGSELGPGRVGNAFWIGRAELGLTRSLAFRPTLLYDVGWAGDRTAVTSVGRPLSGAGVGLSFLDGILRVDVSRGIWPEQHWRTDFYLGAPF